MKIDFDSSLPIYSQIENIIKKQIVSENFKTGERLASVRDMAQTFGVNPNTVQRALANLEGEGLLYSERNLGRFITNDNDKVKLLKNELSINILNNFVKNMTELGYNKDNLIDILNNFIKEKGDNHEQI